MAAHNILSAITAEFFIENSTCFAIWNASTAKTHVPFHSGSLHNHIGNNMIKKQSNGNGKRSGCIFISSIPNYSAKPTNQGCVCCGTPLIIKKKLFLSGFTIAFVAYDQASNFGQTFDVDAWWGHIGTFCDDINEKYVTYSQ